VLAAADVGEGHDRDAAHHRAKHVLVKSAYLNMSCESQRTLLETHTGLLLGDVRIDLSRNLRPPGRWCCIGSALSHHGIDRDHGFFDAKDCGPCAASSRLRRRRSSHVFTHDAQHPPFGSSYRRVRFATAGLCPELAMQAQRRPSSFPEILICDVMTQPGAAAYLVQTLGGGVCDGHHVAGRRAQATVVASERP